MPALDDVRVLDLTRLLPGPFCTVLLADFGADVIKVEDTTGGDYMRWMPPLVDEYSAMFHPLNRNKRSLAIDLKNPMGREAFLRLAATADVVVESFRPGVMDRLGIGFAALREVNPRLVLCSISGYGQDGPFRDRAGHDLELRGGRRRAPARRHRRRRARRCPACRSATSVAARWTPRSRS